MQNGPHAADFDVSVLTFIDPVFTGSGSDYDERITAKRLLCHDGTTAALIRFEDVTQRTFNTRAMVRGARAALMLFALSTT